MTGQVGAVRGRVGGVGRYAAGEWAAVAQWLGGRETALGQAGTHWSWGSNTAFPLGQVAAIPLGQVAAHWQGCFAQWRWVGSVGIVGVLGCHIPFSGL